MLTAIAFVYLTASSPFPIRECSTDGDCEMAAAELGCEEVWIKHRPHIEFKCDKSVYERMLTIRGNAIKDDYTDVFGRPK